MIKNPPPKGLPPEYCPVWNDSYSDERGGNIRALLYDLAGFASYEDKAKKYKAVLRAILALLETEDQDTGETINNLIEAVLNE